jgi:hypothetical protein
MLGVTIMKWKVRTALIAVVLGGLIATAIDARANTFAWTYSGAPCNDNLCGPADLFPPQAMNGSGFLTTGAAINNHGRLGNLITDLTGIWNGLTITGLLPTDPNNPLYFFNDNELFPLNPARPTLGFLSVAGIGFLLSDGTGVNLFYERSSLSYFALASTFPLSETLLGGSFGNFTVTSVPCPIVGAGLPGLVLASSGLLGWWRRRKATAPAA